MKKDPRSDQALIMSFKDGDNRSFDVLFRRHSKSVEYYVEKIIHNHATAQDIAQESFIKIMYAIKNEGYQESQLFKAWVMKIAHNLSIDFLRKNQRAPLMVEVQDYLDFHEEDMPVDGQIVSIISKESSGEKNNILKLLEKIPEKQKVVLILRYFEDFSFQEIAEFTGVSINTALGRARYGLINMRNLLKENEINESNFRK